MKQLNSRIVETIDKQRAIIANCSSDEEFLASQEFRELSRRKAELGKSYAELAHRKDELETELETLDGSCN
jgi:hypothetical protein